MSKNKYDEILSLFVSKDELRPKILQPCKRGDYVYATDAIAIVRILAEKTSVDYSQSHEFYTVENMFSAEQYTNQLIDFTPIVEWFATVPMVPIYAPCETCDGEGDVICDYCNHSHDCDDCDGTGNGEVIGQEPRRFDKYIFKNEDIAFSYINLHRLFLTTKLEGKQAEWTVKSKNTLNLFKVGEVEIGLMPIDQSQI